MDRLLFTVIKFIEMDDLEKNKKIYKKCLTLFDRDDNIKKSTRATSKKQKKQKKFRKKFKKCLTERVERDKLIKSPKQGDEKFFEN